MAFSDHPFPDTVSERALERYGPDAPYRHREVIRRWVEDIFVRGGHEGLLELDTTVERAEKVDGEWVLTLRKEGTGSAKNYWWQERFDALVVATGHYDVPWFPDIKGLVEFDKRWPGRVQHSKHFRRGEEYRGKVSKSSGVWRGDGVKGSADDKNRKSSWWAPRSPLTR